HVHSPKFDRWLAGLAVEKVELAAEYRMVGRQFLELTFGGRVHLPDQVADTLVEGSALAAPIDQNESPLQDVILQKRDLLIGELRRFGAVEKQNGSLHQIGDAGLRDIDRLPGEKLRPFGPAADVLREVADVVRMAVPVGAHQGVSLLLSTMLQLIDQY